VKALHGIAYSVVSQVITIKMQATISNILIEAGVMVGLRAFNKLSRIIELPASGLSRHRPVKGMLIYLLAVSTNEAVA